MNSLHGACAIAWVNTAPMLARTASALNGSAQSSTRISPPAPTASPVRSIVPRLPGSRRACATSQIGAAERSSAASEVSNSANTPATACGLSLPLIFERISALVSTTSPPARSTSASSASSSGCGSRSLAMTSISGKCPLSRASVSSRSPSARNLPSRRRCFLSRSERRNLTVGLEKPVIWRRIGLVFAEAALDHLDELGQPLLGGLALHGELDRVPLGGAEHHQAEDRSARGAVPILGHAHLGAGHRGDGRDELGAGPRMQPALVDDHDFAAGLSQGLSPCFYATWPRNSEAIVM